MALGALACLRKSFEEKTKQKAEDKRARTALPQDSSKKGENTASGLNVSTSSDEKIYPENVELAAPDTSVASTQSLPYGSLEEESFSYSFLKEGIDMKRYYFYTKAIKEEGKDPFQLIKETNLYEKMPRNRHLHFLITLEGKEVLVDYQTFIHSSDKELFHRLELISNRDFVVQSYLDQNPLLKKFLVRAFQKALHNYGPENEKELRLLSIPKLPLPMIHLVNKNTEQSPTDQNPANHFSNQQELLKALAQHNYSFEEVTLFTFDFCEEGRTRFKTVELHISFLGDQGVPQLTLSYTKGLKNLQRIEEGENFLSSLQRAFTEGLEKAF